jgi:predicted  nucleic acid-binding Zn-ribbon protein
MTQSHVDDLMLELGRLRHRQETLAKRRERLVERVAWYPNDVNRRDLAALDEEQQSLASRIEELHSRLQSAG